MAICLNEQFNFAKNIKMNIIAYMNMKLLSPAGDFESLKMAVYYGANEVYLGVKNFNARNIEGFNLDTLKQAVDFAHIYGVKVYLTVNILFDDDELQDALDLVVDAYNLGVDAFIIQDLGLAYLINKNYPQIEIHASTQMGLHNLEGVLWAKKLGFKRVVLSRETPLEEIKRIKQNCDIEIEYFAQGALCVCFSGNCYLSSYLCSASGNRGKCKQLCRLPYQLMNDKKLIAKGYLLSAKDFNMLSQLKELLDAGVDAIKIEGRARRPFYVAVATKEYRNALDGLKADKSELELAFNRNYTPGYFHGNSDIISNFKNHIGINIGKIEKVNTGKTFNEFFFTSNRKLNAKSTIKTFKGNEEINTITMYDLKEIKPNFYRSTTTQRVEKGLSVNLIIDNELENATLSFSRKIDFDMKIFAFAGSNIKASFNVNGKEFAVEGEKCEAAINQALSEEEIAKNFAKSEYFAPKLKIETINAFLPKQKLNEFRRSVYEKVFVELTTNDRQILTKTKITTHLPVLKFKDFEIVENASFKSNFKNIIFSPEIYSLENVKMFMENCLKQNKNPFLDIPNFALKEDILLLKNIINETKIPIIANNYFALTFDTEKVAGAALNVYNSISAKCLDMPVITAESDISTRINYPYMTLRHCPIKQHLKTDCSHCLYNKNYKYVMENGKILTLKRKKLATCTFYLA